MPLQIFWGYKNRKDHEILRFILYIKVFSDIWNEAGKEFGYYIIGSNWYLARSGRHHRLKFQYPCKSYCQILGEFTGVPTVRDTAGMPDVQQIGNC